MADEDTTRLPLYRRDGSIRGNALISAVDADRVMAHRWRIDDQGYVCRSVRRGGRSAPIRRIALHRFIMGLELGNDLSVDHINRDRLDNRRSNLRLATQVMQAQNISPSGFSRFRGVYWNKASQKWMARVYVGGVRHYLGLFASEQEAGEAARAFRLEHMPYAHD